jgi:xylulokinase
MTRKYLLGIDIGTTGTKILLIDLTRGIKSDDHRPATLISKQAIWAEEDPLEWWRNVCEGIPDCLNKADVDAKNILAVGVSGMVPTLILVDREGRPLRLSIQQNDARSFAEVEEFKTRVDEENIFKRTGSMITQQSIGPKLLWLARNEPDNLKNAAWIMGSYDYINFLLTGKLSVERNWALESGLYDIHKKDWIDELLELSTIQRGQLPPVQRPDEVIGHLTVSAAAETGLMEGTPVVAGSADHVASAFSAGVRQNGDLLIKLGGAGDILYSLDSLKINKSLYLDFHVIPNLYLINGCMASSGSIIKWFKDQFGSGSDYSQLDAEAMDIPAGSDGLILLPYFLGEKTPLFDPHARGIFFGLSLRHTRAHLYHAILEGISFGFYHHVRVLEEVGLKIQRVRVANGGAASKLWRQITSDVVGFPLEGVENHPGSSLGAAFVAGMGIGAFSNWEEIEKFIHFRTKTTPNLERHEKYKVLFELYRELYQTNRQNFRKLAAFEARGD